MSPLGVGRALHVAARHAACCVAVAAVACGPDVDASVSGGVAATPPDRPAPCRALETRQPNAPEQRPAFPEQTRACGVSRGVAFDVEVVARGLEHPWAVEPLPDGSLLVTERPGRMRVVSARGEVGPPISGLPAVRILGATWT